MRDRRAIARYAGLTGSPDESGTKRREKGLARSDMMFPLMGRFAHSERVYPSPEHQSNHVTALSAREDDDVSLCWC